MTTFESYVRNNILVNNKYGITDVNSLISIKSMALDRTQYPSIIELIKAKKFDVLEKLPFGEGDFEYLEVMQFYDQNNKRYIATVYSNDALEQDPQLIDIFPLK